LRWSLWESMFMNIVAFWALLRKYSNKAYYLVICRVYIRIQGGAIWIDFKMALL